MQVNSYSYGNIVFLKHNPLFLAHFPTISSADIAFIVYYIIDFYLVLS